MQNWTINGAAAHARSFSTASVSVRSNSVAYEKKNQDATGVHPTTNLQMMMMTVIGHTFGLILRSSWSDRRRARDWPPLLYLSVCVRGRGWYLKIKLYAINFNCGTFILTLNEMCLPLFSAPCCLPFLNGDDLRSFANGFMQGNKISDLIRAEASGISTCIKLQYWSNEMSSMRQRHRLELA